MASGNPGAVQFEAFAPTMKTFKRGRDIAAMLGLLPVQRSSGGKQRLGRARREASATDACSSLGQWLLSN